jgi:hypothetical protein
MMLLVDVFSHPILACTDEGTYCTTTTTTTTAAATAITTLTVVDKRVYQCAKLWQQHAIGL